METSVVDVLSGPKIYLVMFFIGVLVWAARQIIPDTVEKHRMWKVALVLLPKLFGGVLCLIPILRPAPESWIPSMMWGVIAGSFSQGAYTLLRKVLPDRMKAFLGSKAARKRETRVP